MRDANVLRAKLQIVLGTDHNDDESQRRKRFAALLAWNPNSLAPHGLLILSLDQVDTIFFR